ncbi:MAG: GrpB family protein [Saccharospirillum sp.]|uniref:GrpB family protein n=1 Tax=Saccharospirillum sp. TaxID=2033801 RepID=UPI003296EAC3
MNQRKIEVVKYNPAWVATFKSEQSLLKQVLGDVAIKIEHIGSTSVPGLAAKPVIDILIEVSDFSELGSESHAMESIGYLVMGENGIAGRRYFQKGGNQRSHHVHAFEAWDADLLRHRAYRDYLIARPDVATEYSETKQIAAAACGNDINQYMSLKDSFIKKHEALAIEWYMNQ